MKTQIMNNLKLAQGMPINKVLEVLIKTNNDKAILALVENGLDPFHEDGCLYCMLADANKEELFEKILAIGGDDFIVKNDCNDNARRMCFRIMPPELTGEV